jgi:hypothetical protein
MPYKRAGVKPKVTVPLLLVAAPGPEADRKASLLEANGFLVTRADNICYAELFAAEQYFDAAVYDSSITPQEQVSLARIMRIRWPWMRLVSMGYLPANFDPDLFDTWSASEETLPTALNQVLIS